ncbi:MAG: hypothetical protein EZS26_003458, partial [Candidatus Ordinivivax streblomastigis]
MNYFHSSWNSSRNKQILNIMKVSLFLLFFSTNLLFAGNLNFLKEKVVTEQSKVGNENEKQDN